MKNLTKFKVGDRVSVKTISTKATLERRHGERDYYTITSINRIWVRVENDSDGHQANNFVLHSPPVVLEEDLFTL